jgi:predicted metalloprotease with PDZ domain
MRLLSTILLVSIAWIGAHAQSTEKDVIIIEKTIDENGNEVSKKIIRKQGNDFSDQELEELLETDERPFGQWDIESLGFGPSAFDGWGEWLNDGSESSEVSIGLSLSFENGRTSVVDVYGGTGADDSDIRPGDEIISIEDTPIVSYEDIKDILKGRKAGDEVKIVIYRDGDEIEKYVNLKRKRSNSFSFDLPEDFGTGEEFFFNFGDSNFGIDIDSIFRSFGTPNLDSLLRGFNLGDDGNPFRSFDFEGFAPGASPQKKLGQGASLGVMIEDARDGVAIADVLSESAADKAGMKSGDVIKRFNDNVVTSYRELTMLVGLVESGQTVSVEVERKGKIKKLDVTMD